MSSTRQAFIARAVIVLLLAISAAGGAAWGSMPEGSFGIIYGS